MKKKNLLISALLFISLCTSACDFSAFGGGVASSNNNSETPASSDTSRNDESGSSNQSTGSTESNSSGSSSNSASSSQNSNQSSSGGNQSSSSGNQSSSSGGNQSSGGSQSSSGGSSSQQQPAHKEFEIVGINDWHGVVKDTVDKGIGIEKTSTLIKEITANKNSIVISQGDMWQGACESCLTRGFLMTEWMNSLNFVSMTVGNHEYDWGSEYITKNAQLANFPTLGINVLYNSNKQRVDYLQPSTTFVRDGVKFGVIGAIGNCKSSISSRWVKDVYFATGDELTNLVKEESTRLRNQEHCDFIIYSLHGSPVVDQDEVYDLSLSSGHYVDLVLEGHSHNDYIVKDTSDVYHVQCGGYNENFYTITIDLDTSNNKFTINEPVFYDTRYQHSAYDNYALDADASAIIAKYYDQYSYAYEVLGNVTYDISANDLKQKVADLYYEEGFKKWGQQYNIILGGGYTSCRGNYLYAGDVKYSDVFELFPFDNGIYLCSVEGRYLKETQYVKGSRNYFCYWSDYGYSIKQNIQDDVTYYLITDTYNTDYAANHLTEIEVLKPGVPGRFARDLLADYIRDGGWHYETTSHAGTIEDPKTIAEALTYAADHAGSSAGAAGAEGFFYRGEVCAQASKIGGSGDLGNVYVRDEGTPGTEMLIYYLQKTENRNPNWESKEDLKVGDIIVFYGKAFNYNSQTLEFANGAWVYSLNGVLTA